MSITQLAPYAQSAPPLLVPIGGGYSDTYPGLVKAILSRAQGTQVNIVVLPTSYSTNATAITQAEFDLNMRDAEVRRAEIEGACNRAAPAGVTCTAKIAPVFVREDASRPENLAFFQDPALAAVFFLGGDQVVAMEVLANTPLETALAEAYGRGVIISGTSAGCGVQSATMIADYRPNASRSTAFQYGTAWLWNEETRHGLAFGLPNAIIDQHFFQRGRPGRLIEAISRQEVPHVGIGVDAYTGVQVEDHRVVRDVFGLYTVAVFDAETYHAADGVRYGKPGNLLSLRNLLVHLLARGPFSYDLDTRTHSLAAPSVQVSRTWQGFTLPDGAGALMLTGNLGNFSPDEPILATFLSAAGGSNAGPVLVAVTGYPNDRSALRAAERIGAALGRSFETAVFSSEGNPPPVLAGQYAGIILVGRDVSLVKPAELQPLKDLWMEGLPLLADNAAISALGTYYVNYGPEPDVAEAAEKINQKVFWLGIADIQPGLGILPAMFEPQFLGDNRWGRLFALAYHAPAFPAIGIADNAGIWVTGSGSEVIGTNVVLSLDFSQATLALGESDSLVAANGLMDVFAPGDRLAYVDADINARFTPPLPPADLDASLPNDVSQPTQAAAPSVTPAPGTVPSEAVPSTSWNVWIGAGLLGLAALGSLVLYLRMKRK